MTPAICKKYIEGSPSYKQDNGLVNYIFNFRGRSPNLKLLLPAEPFYISAYKVLNPTNEPNYDNKTQLDWLKEFAQNDGRKAVLLWLGNNNVLGTVLGLKTFRSPGKATKLSLWGDTTPSNAHEYQRQQGGICGILMTLVLSLNTC